MIQFVANYDDLSTDKGWQFRFHCDKCGNGHMSAYEASVVGVRGLGRRHRRGLPARGRHSCVCLTA